MKPFRLVSWNIGEGGQPSYLIKESYIWTPRLTSIANSINFLKADVVGVIDAFGWNKWPKGLFEEKFPEYRLSLYPLGDIEDINYAILVKKDISPEEVSIKSVHLFRDRNVIEISLYGVNITVAYLDANDADKRRGEFSFLLSTIKQDIIFGDFNTIFFDTNILFSSIPKFFQYWRTFGLWLCSKDVREMFVHPKVLEAQGWIQMVNTPSTFPLPHFWTGFLAKGIKYRTAWLWRNFFFPCPVLQLDHCLRNTLSKTLRGNFQVEIVSSTSIQKASDHCPIVIDYTA